MSPRSLFILFCLTAVLSLSGGLAFGSVSFSASELWQALQGRGPGAEVILELRLPRVLAAFACGGLLALAGVLLQTLLRNPLADPYILGVSGGASIGALAALLLGAGMIGASVSSLAGALGAVLLVFGLGFRQGDRNIYRLLLTGVVVSAGCGAVVSLMLMLAQPDQVKGMLFWLMGDLSHPEGVGWAVTVLLLATISALFYSGGLDVLSGGADKAAALGLSVQYWQGAIYFSAALLTVTALQLGGSIGFVGLMAPHAVRLLGAGMHRWLVPLSVLLGGSFLVCADTLARTAWSPLQLPVGILTAMLGVPALLWLLGRRG